VNIATIPVRNLRRKPLRSLLMVLVFAIGIMSVVALNYLAGAVGASLEEKLTAFGANILVAPRKETLHVSYGGMALGDVSFEVKELEEAPTIAAIREIHHKDRLSAVAPKLVHVGKVGGQSVGVIGVDFTEEMRIKSYWALEGELPAGPGQVLAGSAAAAAFSLAPGAKFSLDGREYTVSGLLLPTGGDDDQVLFMDLHALQAATGNAGLVHFVEVAALCSGCPIEDIVTQINAGLPGVEVSALQQVVRQRMATVDFVKHLALTVSLVILLTACVMIGLSIFSAVSERKHEIGVLRAMGFPKASVYLVFSFEALAIGLAAAIVGYLGGFGLSGPMLGWLALTDGAALTFSPAHFAATIGAVLLLAAAAAAWPALKAARTDPSTALITL
jgi:putative ABC transport system permease protein